MSPRQFEPLIVEARLAHLQRLLHDLETVGPLDAARLEKESITRLALERILTQLVEFAVAINSHLGAALLGKAKVDYAGSFNLAVEAGAISEETAARLRPSTGTRNILIHQYLDVDLAQVAEAAARAPEDYGRYVREVADFLLERGEV